MLLDRGHCADITTRFMSQLMKYSLLEYVDF